MSCSRVLDLFAILNVLDALVAEKDTIILVALPPVLSNHCPGLLSVTRRTGVSLT
jgi:hypothetical protein